jgi:hypothetical protein
MNSIKKKSVKDSDSASSGRITNAPTKINLYQNIPQVEVSLDEFEEYALARLKVRACRWCSVADTQRATMQ